jgi:hypothetical protein
MRGSEGASLFDHLVGPGEQRGWHLHPKSPSRIEIDFQNEVSRLLDW